MFEQSWARAHTNENKNIKTRGQSLLPIIVKYSFDVFIKAQLNEY